jgi:autotransporter-associated beta strand protein
LLSFQFPLSFLKAGTTSWTGSAGNGLWSDEGNWSSGVPTADSDASLSIPGHINVSLGGATRQALTITEGGGLESSLILSDGTLDTAGIWAGGFTTINSGLTNTLSSQLTLDRELTVNGPISGSGYTLDIRSCALNGANTYQGNTIINGSLVLAGSILASPVIRVTDGAYLDLRNANAFGDENAQTIELWGGAINIDYYPPTETVLPNVKLTGRFATIVNTSVPSTATSLIRDTGSTLFLDLQGAGSLKLNPPPPDLFGDGTTPNRLPIAPWTRAVQFHDDQSEEDVFATYDSASGFRPLRFDEFSPVPIAGGNVRLVNRFAQGGDMNINSLTITDATLVLDHSTFSVTSGGIILNGSASIMGTGSLVLPREGIIYVTGTLPKGIDAPINGGTLVKAGDGVLDLVQPNGYSGGTILSSGTLVVKHSDALGTGPIVLRGGHLHFEMGSAVPLKNDIQIEKSSTITVPSRTVLTMSGYVSGNDIAMVDRAPLSLTSNDITFHFTGTGAATGAYGFRVGNAGTLLIDGSMPSPDSFFGDGGGGGPIALGGNGVIAGGLEAVAATFSPGDAPDGSAGRLTVGDAVFYGNKMRFDVNGLLPGEGYDQLVVTRSLLLSPNPINDNDLDVLFGFSPAPGMKFKIIDNQFSGAVDGFFKGLPEGTVFARDGQNLEISYVAGDGNDVVLTVVPEPTSALLTAASLILLLRRQRV